MCFDKWKWHKHSSTDHRRCFIFLTLCIYAKQNICAHVNLESNTNLFIWYSLTKSVVPSKVVSVFLLETIGLKYYIIKIEHTFTIFKWINCSIGKNVSLTEKSNNFSRAIMAKTGYHYVR